MQEELSEIVLILVGSTFIILLLIALIIMALFISQKRKFRYRQEMQDLKYNYQQEIMKTQIETQLATFHTISQELHDNVGSLVSMAMVHLKAGEAQTHQQDAHALLNEAMDILRDISRSINPENIQKRGLRQSIENELHRLKRTRKFKTHFECVGEEMVIDGEKQIVLFRIIQEALNNVIKHSGGESIWIDLEFGSDRMQVVIRDDGRGFVFNPETGDSVLSSGLANMNKRARMIDASLDIKSELDKGTTVTLTYPAH